MRLNIKVMLSIVALPFCAALIGCADTIMEPSFESGVVRPATRPTPVVKAPVYKNGDWWKVKIELKGLDGFRWKFDYSDYHLEIQEGKPKLYGIDGTNKDEFDCPEVEDEILGKITRKLKFPLRVGDSWNHRFRRWGEKSLRWKRLTVEYKVLGWEKVQTPKGVFEAFKLSSFVNYSSSGHEHEEIGIYYYSPKVKAIILHRHIKLHPPVIERDRTITVVDFKVNN